MSVQHVFNEIKRPLSNVDIENAVKGIVIRDYPDLQNMDINEFFGKGNLVCLLYRKETQDVGHWVLLQRLDRKTVEFFCPYGSLLDRDDLPCDNPDLSKMLREGGVKKVIFNNFPLQRYDKNISTCGRWCILRGLFKNTPLNNFIEMVQSNPYVKGKGMYDLYVYMMTGDI